MVALATMSVLIFVFVLQFPLPLVAGLSVQITLMVILRRKYTIDRQGGNMASSGFRFGGFRKDDDRAANFCCAQCGRRHTRSVCPSCGSKQKKLA